MFRWFALTVFLASLSAVVRHARPAREPIPRTRAFVVSPLFGAVLLYLADPRWMAWASLSIPSWFRWIGVALGIAVIPLFHWVLGTFSANRSETASADQPRRLVTSGPYRWVRHPMYAVAIALSWSLGLMAANWFILSWTMVVLIAVLLVVVPREEARLLERFGAEYLRYRSETGSFLPFLPSGRT